MCSRYALHGEISRGWFENTQSKVLDRAGLDVRNDVLPLSPMIISTTGGIPVDDHCRAIFDSGKMWYTGLYAAGRSAYTGMHGSLLCRGT